MATDAITNPFKKQADEYRNFLNSPLRKYVHRYTFQQTVGDVTDKRLIDIGCGDGTAAREYKESGAIEVVGVDLSDELLNAAWDCEKENPLGIRYYIGNALELKNSPIPAIHNEYFDVVTNSMLLHFYKNKGELVDFFQGAYKLLKQGGRIFGILANSDNLLNSTDEQKHGLCSCVRANSSEEIKEGDMVSAGLKHGDSVCCCDIFYLKEKTYEAAAIEAGFKDFKWLNEEHLVSAEGLEKYGRKYFEHSLQHPLSLIFQAIKE